MENLISDDLDSMKNLCLDLREHATKLINHGKKKEMIPLINEKKYIVSKKFVIYAKKDLVMMMTIKIIIETEIIAIIQENKKSCS